MHIKSHFRVTFLLKLGLEKCVVVDFKASELLGVVGDYSPLYPVHTYRTLQLKTDFMEYICGVTRCNKTQVIFLCTQ